MEPIGKSNEIKIGKLRLGGNNPVLLQSMTNTDTNDVEASVAQCIRIIEAGAGLVRLTAQGKREVGNLSLIGKKLREAGYNTPLVADIHFKADLAIEAAMVCEKVRINPGNYMKGGGPGSLLPRLLDVCKKHDTAIRIGVNHGSLGSSILERFGDTPEGMAESAMEFLRICQDEDFQNVLVSMKSSNPRVMVQAVRRLLSRMHEERMNYPLHLGVTEAGDGPEARIKSAAGMAPLLMEGIGDTIRVSLTEAPEEEIPVGKQIAGLFERPERLPYNRFQNLGWDPFNFERRKVKSVSGLGGGTRVKIVSDRPPDEKLDIRPAAIIDKCIDFNKWEISPGQLNEGQILLLEKGDNSMQEVKEKLSRFCKTNHTNPIIFKTTFNTDDLERFRLELAGQLGFLLVDGMLDAVWVENPGMSYSETNDSLLMVLQAAGARISKTEYIACPSCGRTHFDLVSRLKEIRRSTTHLPTLKIGVMGCIVNGPGEMADADYGYVGAGPGRVSIYKGHEPMIKNIPEQEALEALVSLIKSEGDWIDPPKQG